MSERPGSGKGETMAKTKLSYEDFRKQAQAAGLLASFSDADLRLAMEQPEAGLSILSFKKDYADAATDEARALANAGAEQVRRQYGRYLGGPDGSRYMPLDGDETEDESYVNQMGGAGTADGASARRQGLPAYYGEADRLWTDHRKQYLREGELAYRNALGEGAANTGGIASTAAVAAAQQAQNYYGAKAADARSALYQQAFENWLAERELGLRETAEQRESGGAQEQQSFDNAMAIWKAYGYVTEGVAGTLGLPVGTAYTDQAYNEWKQAYEEAKSGVRTGKTQYDAVNLGERVVKETAADHATLRYGANSLDVKAMQERLIALGYSCGDAGADGKFGTGTHRALLRFQKDSGIYADGVCGPVTWTALLDAAGAET